MPDPQRLLEYSSAARCLVAANQRDQAPDAVRARVLTSLGLAVGATAVASTMAGTASASSIAVSASPTAGAAQSGIFAKLTMLAAKGTVLKTIGGVVLVGGAMYGAAEVTAQGTMMDATKGPVPAQVVANIVASKAHEARSAQEAHRDAPASPEAAMVPVPSELALDVTDLPLAADKSPVVAPRSNPSRVPTAPTPSDETSSLEDELELIHRAREELKDGNQTAAHKTLREYEKRFAGGKLRPEAEALRDRLRK